jgi:hypothetical protein
MPDGVALTTTLTFSGNFCSEGPNFVCGPIGGKSIAPVADLNVSGTYGLRRYDDAPKPAFIDCDQDAGDYP